MTMSNTHKLVEDAYRKELAWIKDEKQREAWLKEWLRVYSIGYAAANGENEDRK